jgi:gluconolactonase
MTIDDEGNPYLTSRGVTVLLDKTGKQFEHIDMSGPWTANITLVGKDRDVRFITASKNAYELKMRVKRAR